ncbi:heterokaryon incompatibility protein-domain-containing protein [Boletus edulis]|nr:heterokaryon incompatibility protein-domain-containing protein [Boletus edulis]
MQFLKGIFRSRKKESPLKLPLSRTITEAFTEYINNEIPARFIDTSRMRFVSRRDVFHVFQDEIATVTEERVQERITSLRDPLATYQPRRETILRQMIQEIVNYVVLSHRWDEVGGEPSYQDISSGKRRITQFKKLTQFCKTVRKLGCKLAWVDTCCIDKTNAAELSEAIHAMYKWYAHSSLCIAYLADSTSYADWDRESWFTRGWTLQELLAPRRLKFYNKNWQPFTPSSADDRQSDDIIPSLTKVTGITSTVFRADNSHGVHGHSFWEIMSWASKRQTTRTEDRAYSLVGLLHVNLTIAYGEGYRAFARLVEAIAAKNPSWDVFAWFGQPSVDHFALPLSPASYPRFDARMAEGRVGVQDISLTPYGLSLKSLPPIPMEVSTVIDPEGPGKPFLVSLKPQSDRECSLGRFGNLAVECGATRLKTIRDARRLSACILNHHGKRNRDQGKLVVGAEYICILLYSDAGDDEASWLKLTTDNFLLVSCTGSPDTVTQKSDSKDTQGVGIAEPKVFSLSLVTTFIRSPTSL